MPASSHFPETRLDAARKHGAFDYEAEFRVEIGRARVETQRTHKHARSVNRERFRMQARTGTAGLPGLARRCRAPHAAQFKKLDAPSGSDLRRCA